MGYTTPIIPCTPSPSCQRPRCHPQMPPCANPEKCLKVCRSKNVRRPCESALQIMANRAKVKCSTCQMYKNPETVKMWLKRKDMEDRLKRDDEYDGTHKYLDYVRTKGSPRALTDCCAGHGHRGRLARGPPPSENKKEQRSARFDSSKEEEEEELYLTPKERKKRERQIEKAMKKAADDEQRAKRREAKLVEKAIKLKEKAEQKAEKIARRARYKAEDLAKEMSKKAAKRAKREALNVVKASKDEAIKEIKSAVFN